VVATLADAGSDVAAMSVSEEERATNHKRETLSHLGDARRANEAPLDA
jgi:hypothetical protein